MWEAGSTKSQCIWLSIYNTLRIIAKHMKPVSGEMKSESVKVPCQRLRLRQAGTKTAQKSEDATHSPRLWCSSLAKLLCLSPMGWNVRLSWNGGSVVFQLPATSRSAQRPGSERSPAWQQFPRLSSHQAQKSWQEEHLTINSPIMCNCTCIAKGSTPNHHSLRL